MRELGWGWSGLDGVGWEWLWDATEDGVMGNGESINLCDSKSGLILCNWVARWLGIGMGWIDG